MPTGDIARGSMTKVTAAPITSTGRGTLQRVPGRNPHGLEGSAALLDNVVTIPAALLGRMIGHLADAQERARARTVAMAFDLDLPLLPT